MLKQIDIDRMETVSRAEVAKRMQQFYERFFEIEKKQPPNAPPPKKANYGQR